MTIHSITQYLESIAPIPYQESYDNSGLIVGDQNTEVKGILITLDTTEEVVAEAIAKNCNLIISHHPIIFSGIKKLNGKNYVERTVIMAIQNNIAIYAAHTNLDNIANGVSYKMAEKLNLQNIKILSPKKNTLSKLTFYCPSDSTAKILLALHKAGAGEIGNYSNCSFTSTGIGSFKPNINSNPVNGKIGEMSVIEENRIEVLMPNHLQKNILYALKDSHPYEEVAYYIQSLENENQEVGSGAIGEIEYKTDELIFLKFIKKQFNVVGLRHTALLNKKIHKIAVCGGSGSFLLKEAIAAHADVFITSDFKYHEYFDAENKIVIVDIGHYESEECTKEIFYDLLNKKFSNIATLMGETVTKPYNYL